MLASQKTACSNPCHIYCSLLNAQIRKLGITFDSSLIILTYLILNYQLMSILSFDVPLKQCNYLQPLCHYLVQPNKNLSPGILQ